jgi:arylsulfatase A-like enzyme
LDGYNQMDAILRWPGHVPADSIQNGIFSGLDWLPTFTAVAGNLNIVQELLTGKKIGDRTVRLARSVLTITSSASSTNHRAG